MVQERTCDYTGEDIEPGTGTMYVQNDGTILWFKDSKARKNYMMGRESRDLEWIGYEEDEEAETEAAEEEVGSDEAEVEETAEEEAETEESVDAEADEAPEADVEAEEDVEEEETEAEA